MASVADLEAWRDALIEQRAKGIRTVDYEGKRVEYRSDAEMAAAIAALEERIARSSPIRPRKLRFSTGKGV